MTPTLLSRDYSHAQLRLRGIKRKIAGKIQSPTSSLGLVPQTRFQIITVTTIHPKYIIHFPYHPQSAEFISISAPQLRSFLQ